MVGVPQLIRMDIHLSNSIIHIAQILTAAQMQHSYMFDSKMFNYL